MKARSVPKSAAFAALFAQAHAAGLAAGKAAQTVPMIVGDETFPFSGQIDYSKRTYYVEGGVCGFAWIHVKPGTSSFAKWLVKQGKASPSDYYGGVLIFVHEFGQSLARKEAYASAFAAVLQEAGIKAWSASRMD